MSLATRLLQHARWRAQRVTLPGKFSKIDALRRLTPIAASPGTPTYLFFPADYAIGPSVYETGGFDEEILVYALEYLGQPQHRGVVVDVGGNIGAIAISLATRHEAKRVIAFEPTPRNLKLLRCNVILNDLEDRIQVEGVAATDRDGPLTMELAESNFGDHRVRVQDIPGDQGETTRSTVSVSGRRLDTALHAVDDVALVWLDTQGHEGQILAGAPELLDKKLPWVVEYWPYALRRAGGYDLFHQLVTRHFAQAVDIRRSIDERRPVVCSSAAISKAVGGHLGDGAEDVTDLILIP